MSDDGGQTFGSVEIGPDTFSVSGLVAAGDEIVATGSVRTNGYAKPAAWSSADGRSWSADDISSLWEFDPRQWSSEHDDVRFSAPTYDPATGTVAAATLNDAAVAVAGSVRTDGRTWETLVYTARQGFDPLARVTPLGSHLSVLTRFDGGSAAELVVEPYLEEVDEVQLVTYEQEPNDLLVADLGGQTVVTATTRRHISEPDRFRVTTTHEPYAYSPDGGLVPGAWAPEGLPEESHPHVASDADGGRSVLITRSWSGDKFVTRSWARDEDGGWQEGTPVDDAHVQLADAVAHTGSGWLAAIETQRDDGSTTHRRAELWQSADGLTWARQEGTFTLPDGRGSSVGAICDSPLGPLAVGWMEDADGQSRATAWRDVDGSWEPSVITDTSGSWLDSCVATDDGVRVFGSDGVAVGSWASTDLSRFTSVDTLAEGLSRDGAVAVPGGYAAGGTARTEQYVGPVLWLSPDAREWTWVPLPVSTASGTSPVVAGTGEDLLVAHAGVLRAWRVPGIASVLTSP